MKVRHTLHVDATCSLNNDVDNYLCHVYASGFLACESVLTVVVCWPEGKHEAAV